MTVDAAVGAETNQVQLSAIGKEAIGQAIQGRIEGQAAVFDRFADPDQFLADDASRADREMADFGIAHLTIRQTHISAAGLDQGMGIGLPERIHHRRFSQGNRIGFGRLPISPSHRESPAQQGLQNLQS